MNLFKRLLAGSGAAGLLVGLGVATPVFATSPFMATIEMACLGGTDTQTITVHSTAGDFVHIEVNVNGSTANGGTQNGTGSANGTGDFTDQWVVADVAAATMATVKIWLFENQGVAYGNGTFSIHPHAQGECPSPTQVNISGSFFDTAQVSNQIKKTCDAGVSGSAGFNVSITVNVTYSSSLSTTITNPAGTALTLPCNGAALALPALPVTSVVTLHEVSLPTGAAAAADTKLTIASEAPVTTIHNAKAAATASPTPSPTARTLATTGAEPGSPVFVWPGVVLIGLLLAGAGTGLLIYRRRN